ncbi:carbon-nitrogen hydrolase family protein [Paeniroseomonas aquatica]|uniref:Carbon-nitrogen hydrolase family protein n=1 Tax=Paeniroseomonas aquatica TaxID=373043 RepID=A0ABT8AB97_9PROT|nr:carbon-nitrogen hydrolase family protein [Paeniroseomonas aquatica]MDN3567083.1 carbon-nitrogen hydrolase family protein [Paeniroseomonas aquatica]
MRVSVIQMNQGSEKQANLDQARQLVEAAVVADRPGLVTLPETWTNLGGGRESRQAAAEVLPAPGSGAAGGPAYELLRGLARSHAIHVHGGSMIEAPGPGDDPEKLFNTTVVFDPGGAEIARYRKIHMFDIVAPDGTGYRESALYGAGERLVTFVAGGITFGCTICYDMRFAEHYVALRQMGAEAILVPSNFTLQTGKDHWEVLLRARAIETQCWIIAAASTGQYLERGQPRSVYGHSLVADPWGHVVAKASDGTGWATARLDPAVTARVRRDMPVLAHRAARHLRFDASGGPPDAGSR